MASLTPTGLETITYGQQGWNAIVTANMQRLNTWLGKLLPLMDSRSRTAGAVPVWNAVNGNWEPSNAVLRKFFDIVAEMDDAISLGVGEPDFT